MSGSAYAFRPATASDLPRLAAWRARPHVALWWGPPEVEPAAEALADSRVALWIVEHEGRPFACAQDYSPHDWPGHPFAHLPPRSRGMDHHIGEPEMIGRGHGSAFVRLHADRLFAAGAPSVGVDPHPDNGRAIGGYLKAGFAIADGPLDTQWGPALLMVRWRAGSRGSRGPDPHPTNAILSGRRHVVPGMDGGTAWTG